MNSYPNELIERISDFSRIGYLQKLQNKVGDFEIYTHIGDWVSKRRSVLECSEDVNLMVWLARANYRQIFSNEIILDIDEPVVDGKVPIKIIYDVVEKLKQTDFSNFIVYNTGGKGYHIHIYENSLLLIPKHRRNDIRKFLIKKFDADLQLYSENKTIQIPGARHRKTLVIKKPIYSYGCKHKDMDKTLTEELKELVLK